MSRLTESASRAALLMMARAPLAYGRRLLNAHALMELAWRAFHHHIKNDCTVSRCSRVERLIKGRRRQVLELIAKVGPIESAMAYTRVLDALAQLHSNAQAATAAAAMDAVVKGNTDAS
jgi:hypothetical protein